MSVWYEVFDDERVLARARERSSRLLIGFAFSSGALVAAAPIATFAVPGGGFVAAACGLALCVHAAWLVRRLTALHRTVWCVRLNAAELVAEDCGRRRGALPWAGVMAVDLGRDGLVVDGLGRDGRARRVVVPADFAGHDDLARRLVDYASAHRRPLLLDGEPLHAAPLDGVLDLGESAAGEPGLG